MAMDSSNLIGIMPTAAQQQQQQYHEHTLELNVSERESLDISQNDDSAMQDSAIQDSATQDSATQENAVVDKEMLRKIKRKEKNKQNRRKKKSLMTNLNQVTASNLQESVAALATTIGGRSTCIVNDPLNAGSFTEPQSAMSAPNNYSLLENGSALLTSNGIAATNPVLPAMGKPAPESAICIMDSANPNVRLSVPDLAHINDCLEHFMYKDLVVLGKLKIANTYLSTSKRVWVICHSPFTAHWVVKKVAELPAFNGRKYSAHTLKEMDGMTKVSMLVPKECSMVHDFSDLMRYLIIQNPGLGFGCCLRELPDLGSLTQETSLDTDASSEKNNLGLPNYGNGIGVNEDNVEMDSTEQTGPIITNDAVTKFDSPAKPDKITTAGLEPEKPEPHHAGKTRSFIFYADDTWLNELRQLHYRPYLGMRRVLCVVHERVLQGLQSTTNKKKRRGGNAKRAKFGIRADTAAPATSVLDRVKEDKEDFQ